MAENTLKARFKHAVLGGTITTDSVPKKGEIIFNESLTNFKVGDGTSTYSQLQDQVPYIYDWAKQASKPSYSWSEINNTPDILWEHGTGTNSIKLIGATASIASGEGAIAAGALGRASGNYSYSTGRFTRAEGNFSIAHGYGNVAEGNSSMAVGSDGAAIGFASYVHGGNWVQEIFLTGTAGATSFTYTIPQANAAWVTRTKLILGEDLFIDYIKSTYIKARVIIEPYVVKITDFTINSDGNGGYYGTVSTAHPLSTEALDGSVYNTIVIQVALGKSSHSEGNGPIALGRSSHAEGEDTIALNKSEHAEGWHNYPHKASDTFGDAGNSIHTIGIGFDDFHPMNAIEVMQNGDFYMYGLGGYDGTNPSSATKVQDVIVTNSSNATVNNNVAAFDGTTGKIIKDSGLNLSITTTTSGNDTIKTYNFS